MKINGERPDVSLESFAEAMIQNPSRNSSYDLPEGLLEKERRYLLDFLKTKGATKAIDSNFSIFGKVVNSDDFKWFLQHGMLSTASQAVDSAEGKRKEFQDILIEQLAWGVIAKVLQSGPKFGCEALPGSIIIFMIDAGFDREVANNLDQFRNLDNEVAKALIKKGRVDSVSFNLQRFTGLDQEVADAFLKLSLQLIHPIGYNLDKFQNLSSEMRQKLIEAGHEIGVQQHFKAFRD